MEEANSDSLPRPTPLLRHTNFLKLWSAQTVSAFGDQFTGLAIPLIAVLMLKATPLQMGVLTAVQPAPFLVLGLLAGVWVDRLPRRPILVIGDFGRGIALLSIPIAAFFHHLSMPQLYVVALTVGVLSLFFDISHQSFLPGLIGRSQLVEGNGKFEATRSIAELSGPSVAGFAIQVISAPAVMILDAISFFVSGGLIMSIVGGEPFREKRLHTPILSEMREGLSLVFGNRYLRSIAGCTATWNLAGGAIWSLYILFATRNLGLGPAKIGLIFGFGGASSLLGAIVAGRLANKLGVGHVIIGAAIVGAVAGLPLVLATPRRAFPLLALSALVSNFSHPVYNINQVSLRQTITPHRLLGRMSATMRFLVWGTMPIGALIGGEMGRVFGLRPSIASMLIVQATAFLWIFCSPVRSLRAMPQSAE
jgi:MFS family permease